jgi:hypothetical protein
VESCFRLLGTPPAFITIRAHRAGPRTVKWQASTSVDSSGPRRKRAVMELVAFAGRR